MTEQKRDKRTSDLRTVYTAKIQYTAVEVKRLSKLVSRTFQAGSTLLRLAASVVMVGCGLYYGGKWGLLLVAFGCIMFSSGDIITKYRTDKTIEAMNGRTVQVEYKFHEQEMVVLSGSEENHFSYDEIIRLVEDDKYLYLFPRRYQAFMVDSQAVIPKNKDGFKAFITGKTGLEWTKPVSLLMLNVRQIRFNRKNTKKEKI